MTDLLATLANWAQIVSVPLAIIGIVLSIWLYRRGRQRRAISCVFDPLISPVEIKAGDALRGEIEIRYRGQPVDNLFMARATLRNTGNLPIRKTDIVEPLTFRFGPEAELVRQPHIANRKPDNLEATWQLPAAEPPAEVTTAQLQFELLNPGEELTIEFLCTGESRAPGLTARIEGVTQIDIVDSQEMEYWNEIRWAAIVGSIVLVVFVFGLLSLAVSYSDSGQGRLSPLGSLSAVLFGGAIGIFVQVISPLLKLIRHRRSKSLHS